MNTNSNSYTIIYASVMVIIVAFLLAFVSSSLKATQDKNVQLDTKKQILAALNIKNVEDADAEYKKYVKGDMLMNADGTLTENTGDFATNYEKEAKEKGISYETATFPWAASGRAIASDCADGMTKLIFDKETHRVIGGAIVGTNGGELLGEIGLAIEMGCDAEDIALTIHAHTTLHESVGLAAEVFEGSITDLPNAKAKKK